MTVMAPSFAVPVGLVHDFHHLINDLEDVGYEAARALHELDNVAHELREVVVPVAHGHYVHNHLVHHIDRIVAGNDSLVGGDGNDVLVGDNWSYVAPRIMPTADASPGMGHRDSWHCHHEWDHWDHHDDHDGPGDEWTIGNDTLDSGGGNDLIFGDSIAVVAPSMASSPGVSGWVLCAVRHEVEGILEDFVEMSHPQHFGDDCHAVTGGNDTMLGGDGDDILFGQGGDDTLLGGAHNDWLIGGDGKDTLDKGTGKDKSSHGNDYSKDLWEKVQERLIDWTGELDDSPVPCASWVKDFVIDLAGSNGNYKTNGDIKIVLP
jgi:hypothetical protein